MKNKELNNQEEMLKKSHIFGKIISAIEIITIALNIILVIAAVVITTTYFFVKEDEVEPEIVEENTQQKYGDYYLDDIICWNDTSNNNELICQVEPSKYTIIKNIINMVALITIIELLRRCTKSIEIEKTPFNKKTNKYIKKLFIMLLIMTIINISISMIISLVCILFIYHVFKYGYTLQVESDETL